MRIVELTPSQRKRGRWLVRLENGDLLRLGEGEIVALSLYSGMELEEEQLERLRRAEQTARFREYALNALSVRPLSCQELRRKLEEKGCPPGQALEITDRLCELGYLDDAAYAAALVKHYTAKGCGPYKIREELFRRGVPREYWEAALDGTEDPAEAIDAFLERKLGRMEQPDRKDLKRVADALARRGYSWSDIQAALRRYGAETGEESP